MKASLRFPDLIPNKSDIRTCKDMMVRIDDLAPYGAHNSAAIKLLADGSYHTVISVNAIAGKFFSEGTTFSLLTSVKKAHSGMLSLLKEWKELRFK
jgi:hypothetical protein